MFMFSVILINYYVFCPVIFKKLVIEFYHTCRKISLKSLVEKKEHCQPQSLEDAKLYELLELHPNSPFSSTAIPNF